MPGPQGPGEEVATVVDGWQGPEGGRRWEEDLDGVLRPDRWRDEPPDDPWGSEPWRDDRYARPGATGHLDLLSGRTDVVTSIVLVGDRVVDVVRRPARGSEYECAALEVEDALRAQRVRPPEVPQPPGHELQLAWLTTIVGGAEALGTLHAEPLPPEDLSLDGVPERLHARATALADRLSVPARRLLGPEGPTACSRMLTAVLRDVPGTLERSDRDDTAAGAVLWAVARGNDLVGQGRPLPSRALQEALGLSSSPASRGAAFAHALGGGRASFGSSGYYPRQQPDVVPLGDPALLLGAFRRRLVVHRDLALALQESARAS